jgi:hypothetical protein
MAYTITDISVLVHYHLVLSEPDNERADANLAQLVQQLGQMVSRALAVAGSVVGLLRLERVLGRYRPHPP